MAACVEYFQKRGIEHARREAEDLIGDVLGMARVELYMHYDRPLVESELTECRERVRRRSQGEPLAYIHGEVDFFGCRIAVNRHVLIPRQETGQLVDRILQQPKWVTSSGFLWDLCCGSGCVGIALKRHLPHWKVVASDISSEALAVARKNAEANDVEIEFRQGDCLQPFQGEKAHIVVCNPPYLTQAEYADLPIEVRNYEPEGALVGGPTGVEFYERLEAGLPEVLHPQAQVWLEIGHGQGERLIKIFSGTGWKQQMVHLDWAGRERFFSLEIE